MAGDQGELDVVGGSEEVDVQSVVQCAVGRSDKLKLGGCSEHKLSGTCSCDEPGMPGVKLPSRKETSNLFISLRLPTNTKIAFIDLALKGQMYVHNYMFSIWVKKLSYML